MAVLDEDELHALHEHPAAAPGRPAWVRANMVASVDGAATDSDGRTAGLSSAADQQLLVILRRAADVVLVGAGTVRAQRYRPSRTPIAVLTRTGDLDRTVPLFDPAADGPVDRARPIVLATPDVPADRLRTLTRDLTSEVEVIPVGPTPADAVAALVERGLMKILTEGGPHLLADLAAADQLDELCLTIAGQLLGSAAARITDGPVIRPEIGPPILEPVTVLRNGNDLYLRHRIVRSPPAGAGRAELN
jgi:riboflavin biosynthesis pyrimidine reductase